MIYRGRRRRAGKDTGSMPLAMLLTIVAIGATGLIGGTVVGQIRTTGYDVDRAAALNAAQSGIDTGLAQIRAIPVDASGDAALADVPCTGSGTAPGLTLTGTVSAGSRAGFTVRVYYLPAAPPADVDQEGWARTNDLACFHGGLRNAPMYALLAATGTSGGSTRTMVATYLFQSRTKPNVPGGTIKVYGTDQCLAAPKPPTGSDPLRPGAPLVLATCAASDPRQNFTYNPSLQVQLKDSASAAIFPDGACLSAASADHTQVTFADCDATKLAQIWSLNNRDNFEGTQLVRGKRQTDGKCFNVDYTTSPATVVINNVTADNPNKVIGTDGDGTDGTPCSGLTGDYTSYKTFFPDPSAGTGAAGDTTHQLVNYEQFGRCLDVTANTVTSDFMVVFPCKQDPGGAIQWNQVWYLPTVSTGQTSAQGQVYVKTDTGAYYCLSSPGSTASQQWVKLVSCTPGGTVPPSQLWTRSVFTGVNQTSYRIESTYGTTAGAPYCLMPATPPATNAYWTGGGFDSMNISKLVLGACDGSDLEKWNASPTVLSSVVNNYAEK